MGGRDSSIFSHPPPGLGGNCILTHPLGPKHSSLPSESADAPISRNDWHTVVERSHGGNFLSSHHKVGQHS